MRTIELDLNKLVGYSIVGSGEKRIKKLGSAKLGDKWITETSGEMTALADQMNTAAE